mmetsp:Transcript_27703/g.26534  ORF Transcript_27703/g.26534 Transcript_27703/m.26534 type:complete len:87 (+) Transcript_27703:1-261(+)
MDIIRDILQRLPEWCRSSEQSSPTCWMEVDPTHPNLIQQYLPIHHTNSDDNNNNNNTSIEYVQTVQDFCGKDRFVQLRIEPYQTTS